MMPGEPIIIIGGGVSGLVLAQGLKHHSIPFQVYERDASLTARTQGYRFRISDEALDTLRECLSPEQFRKVERTSAYIKEGSLEKPPTQLDATTGEPTVPLFGNEKTPSPIATKQKPLSVDRLTLKKVLLQGIEEFVHFDKTFERFDETATGGVLVTFADGSTASGSFIVAADGGRSKVRSQLLPDFHLLDTGARLIYGKTPWNPALSDVLTPEARGDQALFLDPAHHLFGGAEVMLFSRDENHLVPEDYIYWLLFVREDLLPAGKKHLTSDEAVSVARKATTHWNAGWRAMLETKYNPNALLNRTATTHPRRLPMKYDSRIPVVLIGDAMHAMSTTAALGATTAIRDAGEFLRPLLESRKVDSGEFHFVEARRQYEERVEVYAAEALKKSLMGGKMVFGMRDFDELTPVSAKL